jgi:peptidoglycan/LPS O-acetylase OafA/YrhL
VGIAAAFLWHLHGERLRDRLARTEWLRRGGADVLFVLALGAMALFLRWVVHIGPRRQMTAPDQPWHIYNGILWGIILLLLLLFPLRLKSVLCNSVLARLGVLSYSIYLLHVPFMVLGIKACRQFIPGLIGWNLRTSVVIAVLSVGCYALAAQTYRWIERPFLVRKSRYE